MLKPKKTITSSTKGRRKVKLNPDKMLAGHTKTIALTPAQKRKMASKPKPDKQKYVSNKVKKSGKLKHKEISKAAYERKKARYAKKGSTSGTTNSVSSQTHKKGDKKSVTRVNTTELEKRKKKLITDNRVKNHVKRTLNSRKDNLEGKKVKKNPNKLISRKRLAPPKPGTFPGNYKKGGTKKKK
tara:strand:+ start:592 stop:1143 length:552 start_codon:yes stop_codon:yes gene_type:complete